MTAGISRRTFAAGAASLGLAGACASGVEEAVVSDGKLFARPGAVTAPAQGRGVFRLDAWPQPHVFLPANHDVARPAPLMLLLHGGGGGGDRLLRAFEPLAEEHGVVLLAPEADRRTWDVVRSFQYGREPQFGADVKRVDASLEALFGIAAIDPKRIAIAGMSDGGSYALSLGLRNGGLFSHIMAFSPGGIAPFSEQPKSRIFISHGRKDGVLAFANTAKGMVEGLKAAGADVTFLAFEGDHELRQQEMRAGVEWFLRG
jgi:phospholipase/carboxylesterase